MNRRTLISSLLGAASAPIAAEVFDPERALWIPGKRLISFGPLIAPPPADVRAGVYVDRDAAWLSFHVRRLSNSPDDFTFFGTYARLDGERTLTLTANPYLFRGGSLFRCSPAAQGLFVETEQSRKYGVKWMATPNGLVKMKPGADS